MERVIVNEGTKVNLYQLFEDLQNYTKTNSTNLIKNLFSSYGVVADTYQDGSIKPADTSLLTASGIGMSVTVAAGEAVTEAFQYIRNTGATTVSFPFSSWTPGSSHTLYLAFLQTYGTPVDVMSGFAVGLVGGSQKNSRAHDSFQFVWDTDPGISGLALASLYYTSPGNWNALTDLRYTNVLKLNNDLLSSDIVRKSETGQQTLLASLNIPDLLISSGVNSFELTTGTGVNTLSGTEATGLKTRSHTQNTDTYTNAANFYVGGPPGTGSLVLTVPDAPMPPMNFRVVDIKPTAKSDFISIPYAPLLALSVQTGLIRHDAAVTFKWNWDNVFLLNYPGPNEVLVSLNPGPIQSVVANELIGYHLWHPAGYDYVITDNDATYNITANQLATHLTLQPYGHLINIDTLNNVFVNEEGGAWIHSNANSYDIIARPMINAKDDERTASDEERYETRVISKRSSTSPVSMTAMENYFLGEQLVVNISANSINKSSTGVSLLAGSFTKPSPWKSPVTYKRPFLVKIPDISSVGASISANGSSTGFTINIVGWDLATDFEIVWAADQNGADFSNARAERLVTSSRKIDIATSLTIRYYVKVRPLISGQAVADALGTDVMSGSGGQKPVIYTFGPTSVNLKTYSGTINGYNAGVQGWNLTNLYSPSGSVLVSGYINTGLQGETLTVGTTDYNIEDTIGQYFLALSDANGNYVSAGLAGQTFTIGVSKGARELHTWTGPGFDFVITEIEVNQFGKPGSNVYTTAPTVRVYPLAMESEADSVVLSSPGAARYLQPTDILVTQNWGNRIVRIDLYDPSGSTDANKVGFTGAITLSYRAVTPDEERNGLAR